mmetsp:Transcript_21716/g.48353  ORF Transcript_21716/g.48353 Transcript_21716/m.48353 type:complete len:235 (-) Transcript_21716:14-718(-)
MLLPLWVLSNLGLETGLEGRLWNRGLFPRYGLGEGVGLDPAGAEDVRAERMEVEAEVEEEGAEVEGARVGAIEVEVEAEVEAEVVAEVGADLGGRVGEARVGVMPEAWYSVAISGAGVGDLGLDMGTSVMLLVGSFLISLAIPSSSSERSSNPIGPGAPGHIEGTLEAGGEFSSMCKDSNISCRDLISGRDSSPSVIFLSLCLLRYVTVSPSYSNPRGCPGSADRPIMRRVRTH